MHRDKTQLLPDEQRAVDDLLRTLLVKRPIRDVAQLVREVCKRRRDLDEDGIVAYLGALVRRGEIVRNGARKRLKFVAGGFGNSPGLDAPNYSSTIPAAAPAKAVPATAFAQLSHCGHLAGQLREEFDRLLLMDLERRGDEVSLHPWVLELPRRYPKLCNRAGRTVFSYTRVYTAILRLAERGAVTMKKDQSRWRVRAVKNVTGSDAFAVLHDRSAQTSVKVPADKLAELKDLERRRDQIMEELAKLVNRLESLRFALYCKVLGGVTREPS